MGEESNLNFGSHWYCLIAWLCGLVLAIGTFGCASEFRSKESSLASQSDSLSAKFCGGTGTDLDPYLICTVRHLKNIDGDRLLGDGTIDRGMRGKSFRLVNDIDLNNVSTTSRSFIGYFEGHLNGDGHVLKNFGLNGQVTRPLIAFNTGLIENLSLTNFRVSAAAALVGSNYYLHDIVEGVQTETIKAIGTLRNLNLTNGELYAVGNFVISAGVVVGLNNGRVSEVRLDEVKLTLAGAAHSGGGAGCIAGYNGISGSLDPLISVKDSQISRCTIINTSPGAFWGIGSAVGFNADATVESIVVNDSGDLPLVGRNL